MEGRKKLNEVYKMLNNDPLYLHWHGHDNVYIGNTKSGIEVVYELTAMPEGVCIHMLYVPPAMRQQGIGTKLLHYAIKFIKSGHPDLPIYLLAMTMDKIFPQDALVKWYERNGFYNVIQHNEGPNIMIYVGNDQERQELEEAMSGYGIKVSQ